MGGTFGGSGLSVRAKLVAAIPRGITTTAARAAIRREKTMGTILRGAGGSEDEPKMRNSSSRNSSSKGAARYGPRKRRPNPRTALGGRPPVTRVNNPAGQCA
ncbi:hypothetical protein GCM10023083_52890 [Streptomyces phyllanthi]